MVLQNWISFLKKQKGLFAILMVSQIVSLVCILFVFGVFQNNLYELSANVDTKFLNASFRKSTVTREQLTKVIKTLTDDYDFSIDYIYIDASVKGSDISYQDRVQYKDGVFSYSAVSYTHLDVYKRQVEWQADVAKKTVQKKASATAVEAKSGSLLQKCGNNYVIGCGTAGT